MRYAAEWIVTILIVALVVVLAVAFFLLLLALAIVAGVIRTGWKALNLALDYTFFLPWTMGWVK